MVSTIGFKMHEPLMFSKYACSVWPRRETFSTAKQRLQSFLADVNDHSYTAIKWWKAVIWHLERSIHTPCSAPQHAVKPTDTYSTPSTLTCIKIPWVNPVEIDLLRSSRGHWDKLDHDEACWDERSVHCGRWKYRYINIHEDNHNPAGCTSYLSSEISSEIHCQLGMSG